jgi:hypothetical protein
MLKIYETDKDKNFSFYLNGSTYSISSLSQSFNTLNLYHTNHSSVVARRLFLRNDDLSCYYSNAQVSIEGQDKTLNDDIYSIGASPLVAKLCKGWLQPDSITWMNLLEYNTITWGTIGVRNVPNRQYNPFWLAVEFVGFDSEQIYNTIINSSLNLIITSTEYNHGRTQNKYYYK